MKIIIKSVLMLIFAVLFHRSARGDDDGILKPEEQILSLRERINHLKATNDFSGLRHLAVEAKEMWLKERNSEYSALVFELCLAINSKAANQPELYDAMRDLAHSFIDSEKKESLIISGRLLLLLQGDREYSRGQLKGNQWALERRLRTVRWLRIWKSIRERLASLPMPSDPIYLRVSPPVLSLPDGADPSAVKDPILRKQYEDAIEKNSRNVNAFQKKRDLADFEVRFSRQAQRQLIDAYSKPPYSTEELGTILVDYGVEGTTRSSIMVEAKKRIELRIAHEAKTPKTPIQIQITELEPPKDSPYYADLRLRKPISWQMSAPMVEDVLAMLTEKTGVAFSRDPDIQNDYPATGSTFMLGVPAWMAMEDLAKFPQIEGRWEKDGTGYRLVRNGNPLVIPEVLREEAAAAASRSRYLLYAFIGLGALLALVIGVILIKRHRAPQ